MIDTLEKTILSRRFKTRGPDGFIDVHAVLHQLGDQRPYFSVTTDGGSAHNDITKAFKGTPVQKDLDLLISLHLHDDQGKEMHAKANSAFWLYEGIRLSRSGEERDDYLKLHLEYTKKILMLNDEEMGFLSQTFKVELSLRDSDEAAADAAVARTVERFRLEQRWLDLARKAKEILEKPDYEDPSVNDPEDDTGYAVIDGERIFIERIYAGDPPSIECGPSHHFNVFKDSETAGKAARDYYEEMADRSPEELRAILGDETLIQWGLGQYANPGSVSVKSLDEWLDLWLTAPEDHWASYDSKEIEGKISASVADELGIEHDPDDIEIEVVLYRQ